jgi:hypothetical protein
MNSVALSLVAFTAAATMLTITPGLDTALILRTAFVGNARGAASAGLGIAVGCFCWASLVALVRSQWHLGGAVYSAVGRHTCTARPHLVRMPDSGDATNRRFSEPACHGQCLRSLDRRNIHGIWCGFGTGLPSRVARTADSKFRRVPRRHFRQNLAVEFFDRIGQLRSFTVRKHLLQSGR